MNFSISLQASLIQIEEQNLQRATYIGLAGISSFRSPMSNITDTDAFRVFVVTWNVGGKPPHDGLNLEDFLHVDDSLDLYVFGFQEIVPLNAGNVLVIEDNEPAARWLSLINRTLNKQQRADMKNIQTTSSDYSSSFYSQASNTMVSKDPRSAGTSLFFQRPSLKTVSKNFRTERGWRLKGCNCSSEVEKKYKDSCFRCQQVYIREEDTDEEKSLKRYMVTDVTCSSVSQLKYSLIVSKQMVGIFVTIWARKELVQHIGHLRLACVGRGILGYLGNKGCISVSMSIHQTNFCFICSHLTSGEKEGDELRRNSDVIEILKNTQFPKIFKAPGCRIPEKILDHDRVIWFGDLNYRIALSYSDTRKLLEDNVWDALLEKDQLKIERNAGRIFNGWNEGKIDFAPTYKYSNNSDSYAGEIIASKKKRRTPAWCDRILWYGNGITQFSYFRGESRFSDHRPVCAVFAVDVRLIGSTSKRGFSRSSTKIEIDVEEILSPSRSYMALRNMY